MIHFNTEDDYFDYVGSHPEDKIIVYGAGYTVRKNLKYIGHIDYFCDQRAGQIKTIEGIPCLLPEELAGFAERIIILICVKREDIADEIIQSLDKLSVLAEVFYFFNNPSFSEFDVSPYIYQCQTKNKLRIHIVCGEDGWILTKFAKKLQEELSKFGQDISIATYEDPTADVNHYIHFERLKKIYNKSITVRTTMITHVDSVLLRDMIQYQAQNDVVGICMSMDTLDKLSMWRIPRDKLCYVNPAHDGDILPRKIVLGIMDYFDNSYDVNARTEWIVAVCKKIDCRIFKLEIAGQGWDRIVKQLRELNFEVEYTLNLNKNIYAKWLCSLDYELFYSDICGSGYLDAIAAGIKTIVVSDKNHFTMKNGATVSCRSISDLINILQKMQYEKKKLIDLVKDWTWENYARKHLEIWQYLTKSKPLNGLYIHQSEYVDGFFSLLVSDNRL